MNVAVSAGSVLQYQYGFGNRFSSEAMSGVLPLGQNGPQKPAYGLFSELISGSTFTAPRHLNQSTYVFRVRPSVVSADFEPIRSGDFLTPPLEIPPYPGALRWGPREQDSVRGDFLDGIFTICGNGSPKVQSGMAFHVYNATQSMVNRAFVNTDGEMLILPQTGALRVVTELGIVDVTPGDLVLIPRGLKIRVELIDQSARGFVCENFGLPFVLPELGLLGSHGLANAVDFAVPVAAYEEKRTEYQVVQKYCGNLWASHLDYSPFDVVAWRGNWAPSKYDMRLFAAMGSSTVDHPDPSIFCALSSPSSNVAGGNLDFMILPPRWIVAEHTFRPPGFHRNTVAELLGLIYGSHESRASKFPPGSFSLHNNWTAHGPDVKTFEVARNAQLKPAKIDDALVFLVESRFPFECTKGAMQCPERQRDCVQSWDGFRVRFPNGD